MKITYQIWIKRDNVWYLPDALHFTNPNLVNLEAAANQIKEGDSTIAIRCFADGKYCPKLSILPKD